MVKENSFITIQAFMVNELNLKGNELLIYAVIHGFSQDGESEFTGSLQYLADWCNTSKQTVISTLQSLCEKQLILKNVEFKNNIKFCTYKTSMVFKKLEQGSQNSLTGYSKKFNGGSQNSLPNNINNNITDNIADIEPPVPSYIPKTEYKNCNEALKEIHKLILSHNENQTENKKKISICKDFFYFSQNEARSFTELFKRAKPVEVIEALKNYLKVASADVYISSFSINAFCKNFNNYTAEYFDMSKYVDMPKGGLDELAENTVNEMIEAGFVFRLSVFYNHKEEWFNMGMPKGQELVELVKKWTDAEDNQ